MNDKWLEKRAWETGTSEMVSFHTDDKRKTSVLFARLSCAQCIPDEHRMTVDCEIGTFVVTGPKAAEFYDEFVEHKASKVKADGEGITSVTLVLAED